MVGLPAALLGMLTFADFVRGIEEFGQHIQPLMTSRQHVTGARAA